MSTDYIVSARKYRPQTFRSVVGQGHVTQTLAGAIARGQLAHAYLFTGPRGVGKTTCARIFARSINCLNPTAEFDPCGVCESCVAFAKDRSFNIHEMDAASNNSVEDIRSLNDKVRVAPQIGRYSVYIIDEVHMLSTAAFNAFLKTLEEPPAHAIFILATTEKHKILPTILSRCQCYDFNRIRVEDTVAYLRYICVKEGVAADEESLHIIATKADGGMRDALSTFDMVVSFCGNTLVYDQVAQSVGALDFDTFFSATELALEGNYGGLLVLFDQTLGKGFEGQHFIGGLADHFRSLLVAKNPQTIALLEATEQLAKRYAAQAARAEAGFLFGGINLLSAADGAFRSATNRRLHAELALMKLCGLKGLAVERAVLPKVVPPVGQGTSMAPGTGDVGRGEPQVAAPARQVEQPQSPQVPSPTPHVPTTPPQVPTAQAPTAAPQAPSPTPQVPSATSSVLGLSINAAPKVESTPASPTEPQPAAVERTPEEATAVIKEGFGRVIELWRSRGRMRVATALENYRVAEGRLIITVAGEVLLAEMQATKYDFERDILDTLGMKSVLEFELTEEEAEVSRPVTIDQKLQFLVDKNPDLLVLRDKLDLTV